MDIFLAELGVKEFYLAVNGTNRLRTSLLSSFLQLFCQKWYWFAIKAVYFNAHFVHFPHSDEKRMVLQSLDFTQPLFPILMIFLDKTTYPILNTLVFRTVSSISFVKMGSYTQQTDKVTFVFIICFIQRKFEIIKFPIDNT